MKGETMDPIVGRGKYTYKVNEDWARPPANGEIRACVVSVNSLSRVYCFNRNDQHPIVIFDYDGNCLSSWGAGLFEFQHAIRIDENELCGSATNITGNSISSRQMAGSCRRSAKRASGQIRGYRKTIGARRHGRK